MGMKIDSDHEDIIADINMTPLIDIMLVLLIIFMVTSSISLESGLNIDIPKTSSSTTKNESNIIIISLDSNGTLSIDGQRTNLENLKLLLSKVIQEKGSSSVIFEGDQDASLGKMISIMDLAKEAGATNFAIAAESN